MRKIAFIYPGQGAQKAGMGADFYEESKEAREIYEEADNRLGINLKELCFVENEHLNQTRYTQPAMVTTCLAITAYLKKQGVLPCVTAGLSLGEYAALSACGAMNEMEAIETVYKRGILMEKAVPQGKGAMAAILGLDEHVVQEVLHLRNGVYIANYNCPGQIVITGMKESVAYAMEDLKQAGAKRVVLLNVSGPFHSTYLEEAGKNLLVELDKVNVKDPQIPYVSNVTAEYVYDRHEIRNLLARQVSSPVRWQQTMEQMIDNGIDTFIEIGPGRTLTGFLKKINRSVSCRSVGTVEEAKEIAKMAGRSFAC